MLYPVNPKQLARFREALQPSGAKDDPSDAALLLELLMKHRSALRPWRPDDPTTRLIGQLAEDRRHLVEDRTRLVNAVKSRLKQYFPLALEMLGELDTELACQFLLRWGSLEELQQEEPQAIAAFYRLWKCRHPQLIDERLQKIAAAMPLVTDPAIIQSGRLMVQSLARQLLSLIEPLANYDRHLTQLMDQHADAEIFRSFPGAGPALAPRLLAAFGADRQRLESTGLAKAYCGIAPVMVRSGRTCQVRRRWACNKFLRQNVSRIRRTVSPQKHLGQGLLRPTACPRRQTPGRGPLLGLQVDTHPVSLLADPNLVQRGPLLPATLSQTIAPTKVHGRPMLESVNHSRNKPTP